MPTVTYAILHDRIKCCYVCDPCHVPDNASVIYQCKSFLISFVFNDKGKIDFDKHAAFILTPCKDICSRC